MDNPKPREDISGREITLVRYRPEMADAVYEAIDESRRELGSQLVRYMAWLTPEYVKEDTEKFSHTSEEGWEEGVAFNYALRENGDGRILGIIGLNNIDRMNLLANMGYWVRSSASGKGVATAASRLLAPVGFEDLGLKRIEIVASVENRASQRVAEKTGAKKEGELRDRLLLHGRMHNAYLYSLLPSDLEGP